MTRFNVSMPIKYCICMQRLLVRSAWVKLLYVCAQCPKMLCIKLHFKLAHLFSFFGCVDCILCKVSNICPTVPGPRKCQTFNRQPPASRRRVPSRSRAQGVGPQQRERERKRKREREREREKERERERGEREGERRREREASFQQRYLCYLPHLCRLS